jgi:hypothetical protein
MTAPAQQFFDDPAEAAAFAAYRQAQAAEYGAWVAAEDIFVGMACAYRRGDPVPKSNVEAHGYAARGQVVPAGTPLPEQGQDRTAQLQQRMEALRREQEAIAAELGAAADPEAGTADGSAPAAAGDKPKTRAGRKEG